MGFGLDLPGKDMSVGDFRSDSASYIRLLEDSQFIVALVTVQ